RDEEGEQTYPVLHALWGKADAGAEGFTVGRPIAYLSSLHALLQEEASGTTLGDVLLQARETASAARLVARAPAIFTQGAVPTTGCGRPPRRLPRNTSPTFRGLGAAGSPSTTPALP